MSNCEKETWWVTVRRDNHYPLLIYKDKAYAELVAYPNKDLIIPVQALSTPIEPNSVTEPEALREKLKEERLANNEKVVS